MSHVDSKVEVSEVKHGSHSKVTEQIIVPSAPKIDFIGLLPLENLIAIFEFLKSRDLQHMGWINRKAYEAACEVQTKRYKNLFSKSVLWSYLPTIVLDIPEFNGINFIDYVLTSTELELTEEESNQVSTLSGLWSAVIDEHQNPRDCIGLPIDNVYVLKALAEILLRYRATEGHKPPRTFEEFMSLYLPGLTRLQLFRLYTVYRDLEAYLSTLLIFLEATLRTKGRRNTLYEAQTKIISSPLFYWLTGRNLVALNSYARGCLRYFVNKALEIRAASKISDKRTLEKMEITLSRLTEEDLLDFLSPPGMFVERKIFFDILEANYELLLRKYSKKLILSLIPPPQFPVQKTGMPKFSNTKIASQILQNSILIQKLNEEDLVELLVEVDPSAFPSLIEGNSALQSRLTYNVLKKWLDLDPFVSKEIAKAILRQTHALSKLTIQHIDLLKPYLLDKHNHLNIDNYVLYRKLCIIRDQHPSSAKYNQPIDPEALDNTWLNDKISPLNSHLLYRISRFDHYLSLLVIYKHLSKLENIELIQFSKNCLRNTTLFPKFKLLLQTLPPILKIRANSLCSAQWLELGLIHPELGKIIAKEYIQNLDDNDLNRFARAYNFDITVINAVKRQREDRNQKRKTQVNTTKKEAMHEVEGAWNQVKMAAGQFRSTENLDPADLENFDAAINAAYLATQSPSARSIENLKSYAKKYQSNSSAPWIELGIALFGLAIALSGVLAIVFSVGSIGFFATHAIVGALGGIALTEIGLSVMLAGLDEILCAPKLSCSG